MANTNLIYNVEDKPGWGKTVVFALQQLLAILAATIAVPAIIGHGMSPAAALFGAGVGTLVYLLFTKFKSPVFLGSSFAFLGSMSAAFGGAISAAAGFLGLIMGAILAGLVYVVRAIAVKFAGTNWITKLMPAVVLGPTVAIIGLSLAGNAVGDLLKGSHYVPAVLSNIFDPIGQAKEIAELSVVSTTDLPNGLQYIQYNGAVVSTNMWIALVCGLVTLFTTIVVSVYGKKFLKMIPFIIGILAGYAVAAIFTGIGFAANNDALKVIDFGKFAHMEWLPTFTFVEAFKSFKDFSNAGEFFAYLGTIAVAYVPVAFVVFAEHIADHKNLSSIIGRDLLKEPGLHRTLLGDGLGTTHHGFGGAAHSHGGGIDHQTGGLTAQGVDEVGVLGGKDLVALDFLDIVGQGLLGTADTEGGHNRSFQKGGFFLHDHIVTGAAVDGHGNGGVTQGGELEGAVFMACRDRKFEIAVQVGTGADGGAGNHNGAADDRLALCVGHPAADHPVLGCLGYRLRSNHDGRPFNLVINMDRGEDGIQCLPQPLAVHLGRHGLPGVHIHVDKQIVRLLLDAV